MKYIKTIYESGHIEFDCKKATVIIYNSKRNQKELFQFTPFRKVSNGHFLGFGKVDVQQMFAFIPEDKMLLLKVNDIVVMKFSLKNSDIYKLKEEFESNVVNDHKNYRADKGISKNKVDLLINKYNDEEIKIFTSEGELVGRPIINKNSNGKPYSIKIKGVRESNPDKISEFFETLLNDKIAEGFINKIQLRSRKTHFSKEEIKRAIVQMNLEDGNGKIVVFNEEFNKGNYVFKARIEREQEYNTSYFKRPYFYEFSIEMIDKSRLNGKSNQFKF
jgi:hypothetical protein